MGDLCVVGYIPDQISKPAEWHSASELGGFLVSKGGFSTCFGLEIYKMFRVC